MFIPKSLLVTVQWYQCFILLLIQMDLCSILPLTFFFSPLPFPLGLIFPWTFPPFLVFPLFPFPPLPPLLFRSSLFLFSHPFPFSFFFFLFLFSPVQKNLIWYLFAFFTLFRLRKKLPFSLTFLEMYSSFFPKSLHTCICIIFRKQSLYFLLYFALEGNSLSSTCLEMYSSCSPKTLLICSSH